MLMAAFLFGFLGTEKPRRTARAAEKLPRGRDKPGVAPANVALAHGPANQKPVQQETEE